MNDIKTDENKTKIWGEWEIILADDYIPELDNYPLYTLINKDTAMISAGIHDEENPMFYCVSDADKDFKFKHKDIIKKIVIKNVKNFKFLGVKNKYDNPFSNGKIVTFLHCGDAYNSLSNDEKYQFGVDYYFLEKTGHEIKITPILKSKYPLDYYPNVYLHIDIDKIKNKDLLESFSDDILELQCDKNNCLHHISKNNKRK